MDCPQCGASNPDENGYCGKCGAGLSSPESGVDWAKTYGLEGFGGRVVSEHGKVYVETDYGIGGWRERTRYPRWMITIMLIPSLFILYAFSIWYTLMAFRDTKYWQDYLLYGSFFLGLTTLMTLVVYWVYYRKPRDQRAMDAMIESVQGDLPADDVEDPVQGRMRRL